MGPKRKRSMQAQLRARRKLAKIGDYSARSWPLPLPTGALVTTQAPGGGSVAAVIAGALTAFAVALVAEAEARAAKPPRAPVAPPAPHFPQGAPMLSMSEAARFYFKATYTIECWACSETAVVCAAFDENQRVLPPEAPQHWSIHQGLPYCPEHEVVTTVRDRAHGAEGKLP